MPTVADVLRRKGSEVITVGPGATVLDAARAMNERKIGALIVIAVDGAAPRGTGGRIGGASARRGGESEEIGIVTERDVLMRVVAKERDPRTTLVRDVMTCPVVCCTPSDSVESLRELMRARRIRHVPVMGESGVCGMVSIGDLNAAEAETMAATITVLEEYIQRG